jgi:CcmD family protein
VNLSQAELVAAAYGVVFVFVLVYVAIIAAKLVRLQRETAELLALARGREAAVKRDAAPAVEAPGEA